ncbi:MAG: hypothetical protein ACT4PO_05445 [Actinomycetota bacterium]
MRSVRSLVRLLVVAVASATLLLASASAAIAQLPIDPTSPPVRNDGGWVYQMAIAVFAIGALITFLILLGYMRFAPRFQREEEPKTVRAEPILPGREPPRRPVNITSAPIVVPAPVAVGAPASTAGRTAPAAAPAPATVPAPAEAPRPQPEPSTTPAAADAAPPAAEAPAAEVRASAPAPAERPEVSLDQETFERVRAELLEKGTDRRVAEGQARRAAMIAARKKAGG